MSPVTRILVVANRTASTPQLLDEIHRRSGLGARCGLLIPPEGGDAADWSQTVAFDLVSRAAGCEITEEPCGVDAARTIHQLVADGGYDEVIVSTHAAHHLRWLHHGLPDRLNDLGVKVTVIPPEPDRWGPIDGFPPEWVHAPISPIGNY